MTLQQIAKEIGLKPLCALAMLSREVSSGYVSDLLSDVMANAKAGDLWVTMQTHQNIVAVDEFERNCWRYHYRRPGTGSANFS